MGLTVKEQNPNLNERHRREQEHIFISILRNYIYIFFCFHGFGLASFENHHVNINFFIERDIQTKVAK